MYIFWATRDIKFLSFVAQLSSYANEMRLFFITAWRWWWRFHHKQHTDLLIFSRHSCAMSSSTIMASSGTIDHFSCYYYPASCSNKVFVPRCFLNHDQSCSSLAQFFAAAEAGLVTKGPQLIPLIVDTTDHSSSVLSVHTPHKVCIIIIMGTSEVVLFSQRSSPILKLCA